jgi:hypothetical protein
MATTTPNFGWSVPTPTDLVKDGATAIETLGDSIDASFVDLKGGTTGQVLSKASGTDLDFTWVAQDDSNAIQNAIVDAKGDLIAATAADTPARLAVGTNGQVLTADSTASTGLAWSTVSGGGTTLINETVASGNTAINIGSIPSTYKHLVITWDGLYMSTTGSYYGIRVNADSGSNYAYYYVAAESTSPIGFSLGNEAGALMTIIGNQGTSTSPNQACTGTLTIYNYASTTKLKQFESEIFYYSSNNSRSNWQTTQGVWNNSGTAISSIDFFRGNGTATISNISNTSIRVYGVS